jgi:hypothetical protein
MALAKFMVEKVEMRPERMCTHMNALIKLHAFMMS